MDSTAEITDLVQRYIDDFNARDYPGALGCYHLPFTWLFDDKAVSVTTETEFLTMMEKTREMLDARGLARSELVATTVRMLSDHVALAGVEVVRHQTDGSAGGPIGATYLVHRGKEGWRLVANASHPVEAIVPSPD